MATRLTAKGAKYAKSGTAADNKWQNVRLRGFGPLWVNTSESNVLRKAHRMAGSFTDEAP
jgi:hypothetical protein